MQLRNRYIVDTPLDQAWAVLRDLEQVAPHVPGAEVDTAEGDELHGTLRVKVGSVSARYGGSAALVERDDDGHRLVVKATGRDDGGRGNGVATLTVTASADGSSTAVDLALELTITGKFSRLAADVMSGAADTLVDRFVASLSDALPNGAAAPPPRAEPVDESASGGAPAATTEVEPEPGQPALAEAGTEPVAAVPESEPAPIAEPEDVPASAAPSWARDMAMPASSGRVTNQLAAMLAGLGVAGLFLAWLVRRRRRRS